MITTQSSIPIYLQTQNQSAPQPINQFTGSELNYTIPFMWIIIIMAVVWLITALWQYAALRKTKSELQNKQQALESAIKKHETLQQNIIDISEREQLRIGHELHDGVVHDLTALGLAGDMLQKELAADSPELSTKLHEFVSVIDQSAKKIRGLAKGLSPVNLDEVGLCSAIEKMAKQSAAVSGMQCRCSCSPEIKIPNHETALHIYRIIQEAVNNAVKHSRAKQIEIEMDEQNGEYRFMVRDDGKGFDASKNGHNGMGIYIMKYRANLTGADFHIESNEKNGTAIRFTIQEDRITL